MKTIPALFPTVGGQEEVPLSWDLILHSQVKKKKKKKNLNQPNNNNKQNKKLHNLKVELCCIRRLSGGLKPRK